MMKKITAWLLTALLAAGSCITAFAAESDMPETVMIGDADSDGSITIGDVTLIQQFAAESAAEDAIDMTAADVNRDGVVGIDDATIIQRYLAEFIADFDEWKPEEPVAPLTVEPSALTLEPGESAKLSASADAEFFSGDTAVATVDADGNVTAVNAGETVITATDEYGQTASCTVSVRITPPSKLTVSQPMLALGVGESYRLKAIYDGSRTGYGASFSIDNPAVAAVDAATGVITAKATGYAVVTVTSVNGLTAKCWLTVRKAPTAVSFSSSRVNMIAGESVQFYLRTVNWGEALYSAQYASDNPEVVSVTPSGKVTAHKAGTATITASAYNGKTASTVVTVLANAGSVVKTTTAAVALRADAAWNCSNIVILSKGTAVTTYGTSTDGRWVKAQYGDHCGWIYNKALGVKSNYSVVNVNTLPAVMDDLIFDKNVNKKALFDYVYETTYRNTGNGKIEDLCVYWLNYRRGCCYHNSAMIYYLYNKIGVETVRLIGCNNYGERWEHAWCLCKTTEGWRHVDAHRFVTPPRAASVQYFVTDSVYEQYQAWDKTKYPAAV